MAQFCREETMASEKMRDDIDQCSEILSRRDFDAEKVESAPETEDIFPGDKGSLEAILCTIGLFFALFVGYGSIRIPGMYMPYLLKYQLSNHTHSELGWIASVQLGLTFFVTVFTGRWFDLYGGRVHI
jgi:hypothetical protein